MVGQNTGCGGTGVEGIGRGANSAGVNGINHQGYGGFFFGGQAQLKFYPGIEAGRPTAGTHAEGELYMDSAAALFVRVAGGTPGPWRRVTTTAT